LQKFAKTCQVLGISLLLHTNAQSRQPNARNYIFITYIGLWHCGVFHDVTVTSSLHCQPWLI